ncbi:hypothetical protein [Candidatus Viridilinea mediisalina]|uniref:PIN domain-containing protein n=1 Tax=Candidatus Viridilinea mediisalina TaxID=2024553 RepID=A0A2A6REI8_9CHLR|nr:hypothetical protein [Candidatus Viridilinea mediisalina]PDW01161.1 hypothetical protein CJ255_19570 [Candidatus Viridilinea mediisalina]
MSICLIDTGVLCNLLRVPHRDQRHDEALRQLKAYIEADITLLLPVAAIIETGNHIAQQGDGHIRRATASKFITQVQHALDGTAPWVATPSFDVQLVRGYLAAFPDHAMRGIGMGDLSIIKEFERQCILHRMRRIFIWSYDRDLIGYDRMP